MRQLKLMPHILKVAYFVNKIQQNNDASTKTNTALDCASLYIRR
jgi:hypothetical protein